MDITFDVSNFDKSIEIKDEQPSNRPLIILTIDVLKFVKSIDINFSQPLNIYPICIREGV